MEYGGKQMDLGQEKMTKIEGQHLPLVDVQACPHASLLCLDLLSDDAPTVPDPVASFCVA